MRQQDRARACWHDEGGHDGEGPPPASRGPSGSDLVTPQRRDEVRQLALDDPDKFVRCLRLARVVSLAQLPWWPDFRAAYPWEAACLVLLAREAGVSDR